MRKKYTSKMYMRGVNDWNLLIIKREDQNFYIAIKKVNKIDQPFIIKRKTLIDNGYYIMEFTPLEQFYNVRVFLDNNADVIGYYFDISAGNGEENNIPYYDDLYLDVIYSPYGEGSIKVEDEDELLDALNIGTISTEKYNFARDMCAKLVEEILKKQNPFINMDKKELIQRYFG